MSQLFVIENMIHGFVYNNINLNDILVRKSEGKKVAGEQKHRWKAVHHWRKQMECEHVMSRILT
jgi:hypothetical protein